MDVNDSPDTSATKLRRFLGTFSETTDQELAALYELLEIDFDDVTLPLTGLSPEQRRELTFQSLVNLLQFAATDRPTIILEDVQWIDPSTADFVNQLLEALKGTPVLFVASIRGAPDAVPPDWLHPEAATLIPVTRLSQAETQQLVESTLEAIKPDRTQVEQIVERSDGIPIFIEELAKYQRTIPMDTTRQATEVVPTTLAELIHARVDRLTYGRRLASISAAIGREFPVSILTEVSELSEVDTQKGLDELVESGILAQGYSPFGPAVRFRQMLVHDAVYELLLRRERPGLHRRILDVLERSMPRILETAPHVAAYQLERADDLDAATQEWERAGSMAMRSSAYAEAVEHLKSGIRANARTSDEDARSRRELGLRVSLVGAMIPSLGYGDPQVEEEVERISSLVFSGAVGESLVLALFPKWIMLGRHGEVVAGKALAQQIASLAKGGSRLDRLLAHRIGGTSYLFTADLDLALAEYTNFMALYDPERDAEALQTLHGDHALMVTMGLSEVYTVTGDLIKAKTWRDKVIAAAMASERAHDQVHILAFAGCLHAKLMGDMEECGHRAQTLEDLVTRHDLPFWRGHAQIFNGLYQIHLGDEETGFALALQGAEEIRAASAFSNCWYILVAEAAAELGHIEVGHEMLRYARGSMDKGDLRFSPEYHRIRAMLLAAENAPPAHVQDEFITARKLATDLGANLFLERIDSGLAALAAETGVLRPKNWTI